MAEHEIERIVQEYGRLLVTAGLPVYCVTLYGSQVTGETNAESDIDVVVVLEHIDEAEARSILMDLWGKTVAVDNRLEPVLCDLKEWTGSDCRPIIASARLGGVEIFHSSSPSLATK